MDLRHLHYVIVLSEELHFGRAAERLHMAQPPLSRHIRLIEQELGVKLFHRTKRLVRMTEAGEKFVDEARRVLSHFDYAIKVASRVHDGEIGHLVIGAVTTQKRLLVECVREFARLSPDVRLEFQSLGTDDQAKALQAGRIHVGLLILPLPVQQAGLTVETVATEPRLIGMAEQHRLAAYKRVPLRALADEPFILFTRPLCSGAHDYIVQTCTKAGFTLHIDYEVNNVMTALALVEAGLGISLFPAGIKDFESKGIVFREVDPPFPKVEYALAYKAENDSTVLRAFVAVARKVFAQPPPAYRRNLIRRKRRVADAVIRSSSR